MPGSSPPQSSEKAILRPDRRKGTLRASPNFNACASSKPIWLLTDRSQTDLVTTSAQTARVHRPIWLQAALNSSESKREAGIVFETGLKNLRQLLTRPRSGCTSRGLTTELFVVPVVLAPSIWLQEGPPPTDLIAIVKARRNAAIFADDLGFLTGGGRTTAR